MIESKKTLERLKVQFPVIPDELCNPDYRVDTVNFFDTVGVANGDPQNEGLQRMDAGTGRGIVTNVCRNRILRDTIKIMIENGFPNVRGGIFMQHGAILNPLLEEVYTELGLAPNKEGLALVPDKLASLFINDTDGQVDLPEDFSLVEDDGKWTLHYDGHQSKEQLAESYASFAIIGAQAKKLAQKAVSGAKQTILDDKDKARVTARVMEKWFDVRLMGGVLQTGNAPCGSHRGVLQSTMAYSIDPIECEQITVTTDTVRKLEDAPFKRQTMGTKPVVHYALFRTHTFINACEARKNGVTADDLRLLWTAERAFGDFSRSAIRTHIESAAIYAFVHDNPLGNGHAHELFSRITARLRPGVKVPRNFSDYEILVDEANMPKGVKLVRFFERQLCQAPPRQQSA